MFRKTTVLWGGLFLVSCTTSNPIPLSGKTPVANQKEIQSSVVDLRNHIGDANVVFVRRYAQPTAYPISVRVDDEKVASLSQRRFTAISLPAGEYKVKAKWPFIASQSSIDFNIDVVGDKIQFFELMGEVDITSTGYTTSGATYVGWRELKSDNGIEYLSNCCTYVKPKN